MNFLCIVCESKSTLKLILELGATLTHMNNKTTLSFSYSGMNEQWVLLLVFRHTHKYTHFSFLCFAVFRSKPLISIQRKLVNNISMFISILSLCPSSLIHQIKLTNWIKGGGGGILYIHFYLIMHVVQFIFVHIYCNSFLISF